MSRFSKDELDQAIIDMQALLDDDRPTEADKAPDSPPPISTVGDSSKTISDSASAGGSDRAGTDIGGAPGQGANGAGGDANGAGRSPDSASVKIEGGSSAGGLYALSASSSSPTKTPDTEMALQLNRASLESPLQPQPQPQPQSQPEVSSFSGGAATSSSQALSGISTIPSHQVRRFNDGELTDDIFRSLWTRGEPIVVGNLGGKFRVEWSPEYFKHKYGSQSCLILECQTDQNKRVTVGEFFSWFGKYEGRRDCWKLKVSKNMCLVVDGC